MRCALASTFAILLLACQDPELPPPPIGGSGSPVPPMGGQASGSGADASGTLGSGTLDGGSSESSTTGGGSALLVTGRLVDGPSQLQPVSCDVRLHLLESFDRGSGLPTESFYEERFFVQALPQPYAIASVPDALVGPGDSIYVSTICDVDGDGVDDNLGAYYPTIPAEPVLLPAVGIDLTLDVLF